MRRYRVYSSLMNQTHKGMRKMLPKKEKNSKISALKTLIEYKPDLLHTLDFLIFCEEWSWLKRGKKAIFTESSSVLDRLLSGKFDASELNTLTMPFPSFILAIPEGYEVYGTPIPSCLVTWGRYDHYGDDIIKPLAEKIGLTNPEHAYPEGTFGQMGIQIVYKDPYSKDPLYSRTSLAANSFPALLKSQSFDQFDQLAGHYEGSNFHSIINNERHDRIIQYHLLKIVIAMAIFDQSTEGAYIREGLPGPDVKFSGRLPDDRSISSTMSMPSMPRRPYSGDPVYRSWHFRQLFNERFYRNEHKNKPRGSRWSFVRDAWVGGNDDSAHTLSDPSDQTLH